MRERASSWQLRAALLLHGALPQFAACHAQLQLGCLCHQLGGLALPLDAGADGEVRALRRLPNTSRARCVSCAMTYYWLAQPPARTRLLGQLAAHALQRVSLGAALSRAGRRLLFEPLAVAALLPEPGILK